MEGQNVPFRVKLPSQPSERIYHARRPHRKSREGCAKCKQRRVKCDETRPQCQKCTKLGLDCTYEVILPPGYGRLKRLRGNDGEDENAVISRFLNGVPVATPDGRAHSLAVSSIASQIDGMLQATQGQYKNCLGNLGTLRHFQDTTTPTIISNSGREVMRGKMIRLALESPYLMHSIVAVAIAHLRSALPADNSEKYTLLEAHHWQRAIRQYSKELQSPISPETMDSLFSACLLMTVNSFTIDSYNPHQSFVFSSNPAVSLNWLFVQSGLRHLLGRSQPWLRKSMWWEMFMDSRNNMFDDSRPGREGLHPELAELCGITELSTEKNNPYFLPLRMLTPLLVVEPSVKTFPRITTFMGRLMPDYYERLIAKDPPALVLLAWWLALMLGVDLWWVDNRARSECAAICMYLEDSYDPLVSRLLEFPARACGYMLKHVQLDVPSLAVSSFNFMVDSIESWAPTDPCPLGPEDPEAFMV
ncbi:Zn(II)2Cys6 transcription factor [Aspergillus undulatus]|uniref:Zn(II)2Cys6 transcription factor n=1 Tax=Aspergillus undulatus TaxID=1810928 RepID=UPI003CCDC20E